MPTSYVLSRLNRFYVKKEATEGTVPTFAAANAFAAIRLEAELEQAYIPRRDKIGSRTFPGVIAGGRRSARWSLESHLIPNGTAGTKPDMDPFFEALMGAAGTVYAGGTTHATTPCTTTSITFSAAQVLSVGNFIGFAGEIRCVTAITGGTPGAATAVTVTPAFSAAPGFGATITGTVSYALGSNLSTVSIADYWDPSTAQQRIINMAIVDAMRLSINGETHDLNLSGFGQQVIDSVTFVAGEGGLGSFPTEPASPVRNGVPIAGHYGQAWLGATPSKFTTLLSGALAINNNAMMRDKEFGFQVPQGHAEGMRSILWDWELYETDDATQLALYTAGKARTAIDAFFQLGQTAGQLFGAYTADLIPPVPKKGETDQYTSWGFTGGRAQSATVNGELYIAFG